MSPGQQLYEHKFPKMIKVVTFEDRHFATEMKAFMVPNPKEPTPWRFLTAKSKNIWEQSAVGHHIFSEK